MAEPNSPESPSSRASSPPIHDHDPGTLLHHVGVEYPTRADGYVLLAEIGRGAFATVYRAKVKDRGEDVAIKILDLEELNTNWDEIRREIQIMRQMNHPNVVPIHCAFVEEEELWMVMPLLSAGSCATLMKKLHPTGIKDEAVIAYILYQVLKGLQYFHKDGRIHRDVKAGNILMSRNADVQLADFGVAGTLLENGDRKKNRSTFVGTPCWMAPEVMEQSKGYDYKADIWSFGITAMELGYGRAPYASFQPMKVLLMTLQEDPPTCDIYKDNSYKFSKYYHEMIGKCLRKDVAKRPNAEKLMKHKFFDHMATREQVIERLIKLLPPVNTDHLEPIIRKKKTPQEAAARKPISVESWIFDDPKAVMQQLEAKGTTVDPNHDEHIPVIINFSRPRPEATTAITHPGSDAPTAENVPTSRPAAGSVASDSSQPVDRLSGAASPPTSPPAPIHNLSLTDPAVGAHLAAAAAAATPSLSHTQPLPTAQFTADPNQQHAMLGTGAPLAVNVAPIAPAPVAMLSPNTLQPSPTYPAPTSQPQIVYVQQPVVMGQPGAYPQPVYQPVAGQQYAYPQQQVAQQHYIAPSGQPVAMPVQYAPAGAMMAPQGAVYAGQPPVAYQQQPAANVAAVNPNQGATGEKKGRFVISDQ